MTFAPQLPGRFLTVSRIALPLLLLCASALHAVEPVPARMPLLSKAGPAVAPNMMLTMDDSGSMQFQHMPENVFASDTFTTTNPVGGGTARSDENDTYQTGYLMGTVPGILASTNYVLRALRSADTNTIFYNPQTLYLPWLTSDGVTRLPDSPVAKAYKDPLIRSGAVGTYVDLTTTTAVPAFAPATIAASAMVTGQWYVIATLGTTNYTSGTVQDKWMSGFGRANTVGLLFRHGATAATGTGTVYTTDIVTAGPHNAPWCYAVNANTSGKLSGPTNGCAVAHPAFTHDPGVYFVLTKTGSVYNPLTVAANYTAYSINGATSFPKVAARTDCSGAVGPTGCTQAQERQNYANWFSYYRSRNLLARGSLMEAFGVESTPVTADTLVTGTRYAVISIGTTNFTLVGGTNTVGSVFTATGVGTGNGTARPIAMRMGFGRINKGAGTVDGISTKVIEDSATYGAGGVREFNAARKANLYKWLEDLPATGGTPLVTAMQAVGDYYSRVDTRSPWTDDPSVSTNVVANNRTCRRSYQIMMTDGYWNGTAVTVGNVDGADGPAIADSPLGLTYQYIAAYPYKDITGNTLADVALKYWYTDLQPATQNNVPKGADNPSFWQNMTNYTVGLGVRGTLTPSSASSAGDLPALAAGTKLWPPASGSTTTANVDDLWHAAINSNGKYFSAKNPQELASAVREALAGATAEAGPTAGVVTSSNTLGGNSRKYIPKPESGTWMGDIEAYKLDAVGNVTGLAWKASDTGKIPAPTSRNIVTWDSTAWSTVAFNWGTLSSTSRTDLGTVAATNTTDFTNFLRGDHSKEGSAQPFRSRIDNSKKSFVLGDFVNSSPVLIKGSYDGDYDAASWTGGSAYAAFRTTKAARTAVLFAASNDGMLHAFQDSLASTPVATDGLEVFAYVPRAVYPKLYKLTDKGYGTTSALDHEFFVDGPLRESDAYIKAPSATAASWRNYVFGTLGAGGRAVYALDVTDSPTLGATTVRWEISSAEDDDIGYMQSVVKVGRLQNGKWVAIFGNGYSSTYGRSVLFVVDIEDAASTDAATRAAAIRKLVVEAGPNNGLGGVTLIHNSAGEVESVYAGDLKGNLWKLNYSNAASSYFVVDGGAALFTAKNSSLVEQSVTTSPAVWNHSKGGKIVVFGTGRLFSDTDGTDTQTQSIYSVWDKPSDSFTRPMTRAKLEPRTLTSFSGSGTEALTTFYSMTGTAVDTTTKRGWYIDLNTVLPGGRVVYPVQVLGFTTALVSAVAPKQGTVAACTSGKGEGINFLLSVEDGITPSTKYFDTNGDTFANSSDTGAVAYKAAADGVDAVMSSSESLKDPGGGAREQDCTGSKCSKGGGCVSSPLCPQANTTLVSIQTATGSRSVCVPCGGSQRMWRRIINPPIH